jgi:hypothetical protein
MESMRRLLLIAYNFPPHPSAGALRPGYIARYLPQYGWEATVLTHSTPAPPFKVRTVTTETHAEGVQERLRASIASHSSNPYSPLRRTLRKLRDTLLFPDTLAPWIPSALRTGSRLLKEEQFDAIFSTAHPVSVHVVGGMLAKRSGLPWIADYRDPWAGNAYVERGAIRTRLEHWLERTLLRRAATITTISKPIAEQIGAFHKRDDVRVIPNAYDPAEWETIPDLAPARFNLCYTGSMYDGRRSPDLLFGAIRKLREQRDPAAQAARVHFYGPDSDNVNLSAQQFGVTLQVQVHGRVPRAQAMRAQREAAALLIFLNMDPATANETGSKFLEYLGARRPIIVFGPENSVMRDIIRRYRLGWFASNVEEAQEALRAAYARFTAGTYDLTVDSRVFPTASDLAQRFAQVLDGAIDPAAQHYAARTAVRS